MFLSYFLKWEDANNTAVKQNHMTILCLPCHEYANYISEKFFTLFYYTQVRLSVKILINATLQHVHHFLILAANKMIKTKGFILSLSHLDGCKLISAVPCWNTTNLILPLCQTDPEKGIRSFVNI